MAALVVTATGVTTATRSTTVQMTAMTLSTILMPALFLCDDPLVPIATMDKTRAGMERERQMRDIPQTIIVHSENKRAHMAMPE